MLLKLMWGVAPPLTLTPILFPVIVFPLIVGLVPAPAMKMPLVKLPLMVLFVRLTWEFPLTMQIIAYGPQLILPPNLTTVFFIRPLAFELKMIAPQNPAVLSSVGEVNVMGAAEPSATSPPLILRPPQEVANFTTTPGAMVRVAPEATPTPQATIKGLPDRS